MNLVGARSMEWTPSTFRGIQVRHAVGEDREFAMSLVPRLIASSPVWWRHPRTLFGAYVQVIECVLVAARPDANLLIAERSDEIGLGLALLVAARNCFTRKRQWQVAQIAIADVGSGTSAGHALITAAEEWARSRGEPLMMPGQFWATHPAIMVCREAGLVEGLVSDRGTGR
jgi:hypothetical protein